jgi:hypothetical protein
MIQLSKLFMFMSPLLSCAVIFIITHRRTTLRAIDSVLFSLSLDVNQIKSLEMKGFVAFAAILVIGFFENCSGQAHPTTWSREQRDQRVKRVKFPRG